MLARSNMVMAGYWEQPDATAEAIRDGFFHTGDGGYDRRRSTTSRSPTARRT